MLERRPFRLALERRAMHLVFALVCLISLALPAHSQSLTTAVEPAAWNEHLEIGPVAGLTTAWHLAPRTTGIPLGSTIQLRIRVPRNTRAIWTGAREIDHSHGRSTAEVHFPAPGNSLVSVHFDSSEGQTVSQAMSFEVVDLAARPLTLSAPRLSADAIEIDDANPNASTMAYYFQGSSIAALRELGPAHYRTSISRWVTAEVSVDPAALAPLIEWRLNGVVQKQLGASVRLQSFVARAHQLSAGPEAFASAVHLETYMVRITSPTDDELIPAGEAVTFRAVTDPPGLESEITWLASTKYGTCAPMLGTGAEFTTRFDDTVGESGAWLGVRADNAVVGRDEKAGSCAQAQQAAIVGLSVLPTLDEIPAAPAQLRDLVVSTRALAEQTASGEVCTSGRLAEVAAEFRGQRQGFGASLIFGPYDPFFEDCLDGCIAEHFPGCPPGVLLPECEMSRAFCRAPCTYDILQAGAGADLHLEQTDSSLFFCTRTGEGLRFVARVRNDGSQTAPASMTRFDFGSAGVVEVATPAIPPGEAVDLGPVQPPAGCFQPDCMVTICTDSDNEVPELSETNNCANGICVG